MTLMFELLGDKAKDLTQCDLSETAAPAPVPMGDSKFLYRPATKAQRSHVEASRLKYMPKVFHVEQGISLYPYACRATWGSLR